MKDLIQFISDDCIFESNHPGPVGTLYVGKEAISSYWKNFFRLSPNAHIEIEDIVGFGFKSIMCWKTTREDLEGNKRPVRVVDLFLVKKDSSLKTYRT